MGINKALKPWEFVDQFDEKVDMSKTDRFPRKFRTFKGIDVFYIYMPDKRYGDSFTSKGRLVSKQEVKYKIVMAIRKRDGEYYTRKQI